MASPVKFALLRAPRIFGDRDLRPNSLDRMQVLSGGVLTDRAPHAPTVVLTDGFEFVRLEIEYTADKMADKAATRHLQTCGIQRRLGRKAQVTLTFTLTANLSQFVLSKGYMVTGESGVEFFTDEDAIAQNTASFTVTATAKDVGTKYNIPAYTLNNLTQTRAFLASVTNTEPASGGLDAETDDEAKLRGYRTIRRKKGVLVSADDFEQAAIEVLGVGAVAKCVPLLTPDKLSKKAGYIHLFCLNSDLQPLNAAQEQTLEQAIGAQVPAFLGSPVKTLGSAISVSSIELLGLEINVIATLIPGDNPDRRAQAINAALIAFLRPGSLPLGGTIVLYSLIAVVQNAGVQDVQAININVPRFDPVTSTVSVETFYTSVALPNEWTAAYCRGVILTLVSGTESFEYAFGDEVGDPD